MKKYLLLLLFSSAIFAQEIKQVPKHILLLQNENKLFTKLSLFALNENYDSKKYDHEVSLATVMTLNQNALNTVISQQPEYLQCSIFYDKKPIDIVLYKVKIEADDFRLDTDKQKNVVVEKGVHYRGIINGNVKSIASFNFFKGEMNGIVSGAPFNNLNIGKLETSKNTNDYIVYSDLNLKKNFGFICDTKEQPEIDNSVGNVVEGSVSTKCVAIYFELDYQNYLSRGQNLTATSNWFSSIFNNVQTLYANDGITTAIKSLFIWTAPDPYMGFANSTEYLNAFVNNRTVFNGDIAQFISLNAGGFGGLAYLNGLCGTAKHGYSDIESFFSTVPQFSWTVEVITHELGHQMGSQHTHACAWNGNNTAIDGCGPTANSAYTEGTCPTGPVPYVEKGTIMSYCHLLGSDVGIDFANGFGPQPAARILGKVNAAACLSTDCINTCINTVTNIILQNSTETSINVAWTDEDQTVSNWQIAAVPYPYNSPVWINSNSNSHLFEGLQPNTYYKILVRPICSNTLIADSRSQFVATKINSFYEGAAFTDTGLLVSNYSDMEDWTRTFTPPAGFVTKVVFDSIDLEQDWDYLYVYDGANVNATLLATITGFHTNMTFEATNSTGELTFRFVSDQAVNESGWNATVSCATLGLTAFNKNKFSYYPNPVTRELALNSEEEIEKIQIFSIEGKLIFEQKGSVYETKITTDAYANGTYIVKLAFKEGSTTTFKIVKQ